jgi:hypothetical protein
LPIGTDEAQAFEVDSEHDKPAILTEAPKIPPGALPDEVDHEATIDLDGLNLTYTYSSGRSYRLRFYDDRVSFSQLDTPAPTLTVPYLARRITDAITLVHWMVPGRVGHVSLVIDLDARRIHASALMPGAMELLDGGPITEISGPHTNP